MSPVSKKLLNTSRIRKSRWLNFWALHMLSDTTILCLIEWCGCFQRTRMFTCVVFGLFICSMLMRDVWCVMCDVCDVCDVWYVKCVRVVCECERVYHIICMCVWEREWERERERQRINGADRTDKWMHVMCMYVCMDGWICMCVCICGVMAHVCVS